MRTVQQLMLSMVTNLAGPASFLRPTPIDLIFKIKVAVMIASTSLTRNGKPESRRFTAKLPRHRFYGVGVWNRTRVCDLINIPSASLNAAAE